MSILEKSIHDRTNIDSNISIELPEVKRGEKASVSYNGVLTNSGSEKVFLHYGFDGWHDTDTVPMKKDHNGTFSTEVRVEGKNELEFCFKDSANNWDNNNGSNWKIEINS